jgi:hypothetical protein
MSWNELEELSEYAVKAQTAIEALFAGVKHSVLATERWANSKNIVGYSIHVVFAVGELKTQDNLLPASCSLKKQLNRLIRNVAKEFPNSEDEILIWRAEPRVTYQDYIEKDNNFGFDETSQRIYLRCRLSSMPKDARIITNEEVEVKVIETPIATKVA